MAIIPSELKEIEKKDWRLWLLLIGLFFGLTSFIVLIVFYSDVSSFFEENLDIYSFNFLLIGYVALSLLFVAYIIVQGISLRHLRRDLVEEKINLSITLGNRYQDLKALFEVSTLVNSEEKTSRIFHLISRWAMNCLNADRSSVMILDSQGKKLHCAAAYGYKAELLKNAEVEVGKSVCGWVIEHNQSLLLDPDELHKYKFLDYIKKEGTIFSALCVPLKVRGKSKGVLNVNSFRKDRKFTQEDLKLLTIFAENASVSIDKAELHQENERRTKELKDTLDELIRSQNQLISSQKMRSLGDLASAMAHELNNILAVLAGRAELALEWTKDRKVKGSLKQILEAVTEGEKIIRRIQEFYPTWSAGGPVEIDVNRLVQEIVEFTKPKWQDEAQVKGIKIEVKTELRGTESVRGNPSEIFEALTILMLNAIESMPEGGKISLETETEGDTVTILIKDTGIGLSEEVRKKIFDPCFTTKTVAKAGLGLSLAHRVISRHKGTIELKSEVGIGTTFVVKLPACKRPKKEKLKETKPVCFPRSVDILVVDDNKEVRDIVSKMLTAKGHRVTTAKDGFETLKLFDKKNKFDIAFVNLSLPRSSGWEVVQKIKEKDPEIKAALLTGWGAQIDFKEVKEKSVDFLLTKPFKAEDLQTVLSQVMMEKELT